MLSKQSTFSRVGRVVGTLAFVAALALPATQTFARNDTDHFDFKGGGPDNGCGGVQWADDTWNLLITVQDNGDGTFAMRTEYKGAHFVTRAGASPGAACGTASHGTSVIAGIKGKMNAWADETITSSTYDPDACGQGAHNDGPCSTRSGFVATVFGCTESACADFTAYEFAYSSNDKQLTFDYWRESFNSPDNPDGVVGDIATA